MQNRRLRLFLAADPVGALPGAVRRPPGAAAAASSAGGAPRQRPACCRARRRQRRWAWCAVRGAPLRRCRPLAVRRAQHSAAHPAGRSGKRRRRHVSWAGGRGAASSPGAVTSRGGLGSQVRSFPNKAIASQNCPELCTLGTSTPDHHKRSKTPPASHMPLLRQAPPTSYWHVSGQAPGRSWRRPGGCPAARAAQRESGDAVAVAPDHGAADPCFDAERRAHACPLPQVLLNAPNAVGWLRLALLATAAAVAARGDPLAAWWLAAVSLALDGLDGLLARRLGQVCAALTRIAAMCIGGKWMTRVRPPSEGCTAGVVKSRQTVRLQTAANRGKPP